MTVGIAARSPSVHVAIIFASRLHRLQSTSKKVHANLTFLHVPLFNMHLFVCVKNALSSGVPMTMGHAMAQLAQWLIALSLQAVSTVDIQLTYIIDGDVVDKPRDVWCWFATNFHHELGCLALHHYQWIQRMVNGWTGWMGNHFRWPVNINSSCQTHTCSTTNAITITSYHHIIISS